MLMSDIYNTIFGRLRRPHIELFILFIYLFTVIIHDYSRLFENVFNYKVASNGNRKHEVEKQFK